MMTLKKTRFRGRVIIGPADHMLRANRITSSVELSEKRRFTRFQAPQNAFALLRGPAGKLGQIIDISKGGLALRYVANSGQPSKSSQLDIFLANNDFNLEKVSFEIVSDFEIGKQGPSSSITMRRCGVQFGPLNQDHISRLEYFIQNYSLGVVP